MCLIWSQYTELVAPYTSAVWWLGKLGDRCTSVLSIVLESTPPALVYSAWISVQSVICFPLCSEVQEGILKWRCPVRVQGVHHITQPTSKDNKIQFSNIMVVRCSFIANGKCIYRSNSNFPICIFFFFIFTISRTRLQPSKQDRATIFWDVSGFWPLCSHYQQDKVQEA